MIDKITKQILNQKEGFKASVFLPVENNRALVICPYCGFNNWVEDLSIRSNKINVCEECDKPFFVIFESLDNLKSKKKVEAPKPTQETNKYKECSSVCGGICHKKKSKLEQYKENEERRKMNISSRPEDITVTCKFCGAKKLLSDAERYDEVFICDECGNFNMDIFNKDTGIPEYDQFFMHIAEEIAKSSTCTKRKQSIVIINKNKEIVYANYSRPPLSLSSCFCSAPNYKCSLVDLNKIKPFLSDCSTIYIYTADKQGDFFKLKDEEQSLAKTISKLNYKNIRIINECIKLK